MQETEYKRMYDAEDSHWWYRGVRLYLEVFLWERLRGMPVLLDAGCGSGGNLEWLRGLGFQALGFDLSLAGVRFCRKRGIKGALAADINRLPYADGSFDGVLCCNVFESEEVDEAAALAELSRVLLPRGFALVTVSGWPALADSHDEAVHCVRRYTRGSIRRTFNAAGFRIRTVRAMFSTMFPLFILYRLARRLFPAGGSDVFPLPDIINKFFFLWVKVDEFISQFVPLPFGSSYLVLLEKNLG